MRRKIKRKFSNYTTLGSQYRAEFRKQLRMFITFTFGFTIAFTWREVSFEGSKKFWIWLTGSHGSGSIGGAFFITIVSLLLIYATSYWLKEKPTTTLHK